MLRLNLCREEIRDVISVQAGCATPTPKVRRRLPNALEEQGSTLNMREVWNTEKVARGVWRRLPGWDGRRLADAISGIGVALRRGGEGQTQNARSHTNAIVFQLRGSQLIAFRGGQWRASFACAHTRSAHKETSVGRVSVASVWSARRVDSMGRKPHRAFGKACASTPARRLQIAQTGLFINTEWKCMGTPEPIKMRR